MPCGNGRCHHSCCAPSGRRLGRRARLLFGANTAANRGRVTGLPDAFRDGVTRERAREAATSTSADVLDVAIGDKKEVRRAAASAPGVTHDQQVTLAGHDDVHTRSALGRNTHAGADILAGLAGDGDKRVRLAVASNTSTGEDVLRDLAADESEEVRCQALVNPSTPRGVLDELMGRGGTGKERRFAMVNLVRRGERLDSFADDRSPEVRGVVAWHTDDDGLRHRMLTGDPSGSVRWMAARRIGKQVDAELAERVLVDPDVRVRREVADSAEDPDVLRVLARDVDEEVIMSVVGNSATPDDVVLAHAEAGNDRAKVEHARRIGPTAARMLPLRLKSSHLREVLASRSRDREELVSLARDENERVLDAAFGSLRSLPDVDREAALSELAFSEDRRVRLRVARSSWDAGLLSTLAGDGDVRVRECVARRANLVDQSARDALAGDADAGVAGAAFSSSPPGSVSRDVRARVAVSHPDAGVRARAIGDDEDLLRAALMSGDPVGESAALSAAHRVRGVKLSKSPFSSDEVDVLLASSDEGVCIRGAEYASGAVQVARAVEVARVRGDDALVGRLAFRTGASGAVRAGVWASLDADGRERLASVADRDGEPDTLALASRDTSVGVRMVAALSAATPRSDLVRLAASKAKSGNAWRVAAAARRTLAAFDGGGSGAAA